MACKKQDCCSPAIFPTPGNGIIPSFLFCNEEQTASASCPEGFHNSSGPNTVTVTVPANTVGGVTQEIANAEAYAQALAQAQAQLTCIPDVTPPPPEDVWCVQWGAPALAVINEHYIPISAQDINTGVITTFDPGTWDGQMEGNFTLGQKPDVLLQLQDSSFLRLRFLPNPFATPFPGTYVWRIAWFWSTEGGQRDFIGGGSPSPFGPSSEYVSGPYTDSPSLPYRWTSILGGLLGGPPGWYGLPDPVAGQFDVTTCSTPPPPVEEDMPLDQAVYDSGTDKIFGVRGQWIFQCNATTGAKEAELRFTDNALKVASLTIFGGNIYCAVDYNPGIDWSGTPPGPDRDVFVVDAATFTVTGRLNLYVAEGNYSYDDTPAWARLVTNGTLLYGVSENNGIGIWKCDPSNVAATFANIGNSRGQNDLEYDATNDVIWNVNSFSPNINAYSPSFGSSCSNSGGCGPVSGVCYNAAQNKVYAVRGTGIIVIVDASTAVPAFTSFAFTTANTGRANCNAFRIKSVNGLAGNPFNGKVLIPGWKDDTVLVWNPATDNPADMVVKTGFTAPVDIVNTPTKSFAVQNSGVGLLEIT